MQDQSSVCGYCGQEIQRSVPRWAGRQPEEFWHCECAERVGITTVADSDSMKIQRKLRNMVALTAEIDNLRFMISLLEQQLRQERNAFRSRWPGE